MYNKKKIIICSFLMCVLLLGLAGCKEKNSLADVFNEDEVIQEAEAIAKDCLEQDYQAVIDRGNLMFQEAASAEEWDTQIGKYMEKAGVYVENKSVTVEGVEEGGASYAACIIIVKCENGDVKFNITFDEDMKLNGLFL